MKSLRRNAIGDLIDAMALRHGHRHQRRMGFIRKVMGLPLVVKPIAEVSE
jgi:hypothetical protein